MTATAETTPTLDELRTRLEQERAEADAADRDLGAAALDAKDPKRASKRVADAHAAVERTRAAIGELERRERERARHEGELAAARDRLRSYEWAAAYLEGIVEVQRAQEQVRAAVDRLGEVAKGIPRPVGVVKSPGTGRPLRWDVETLDQGLIRSLPAGRMGRFPIQRLKDLPDKWNATPDQLEARTAKASELAAAEAEKVAELEQAERTR